MYSLTCSLLGIDELGNMIPAVISVHAQDFTEDFTPRLLGEENSIFSFTEHFCKHSI